MFVAGPSFKENQKKFDKSSKRIQKEIKEVQNPNDAYRSVLLVYRKNKI